MQSVEIPRVGSNPYYAHPDASSSQGTCQRFLYQKNGVGTCTGEGNRQGNAKPHLPLFLANPLHFRTSQDKFKASSGWVENFKHRHDLRKGGSWDRASNAAVWANSAAKYGVPGSTAADAAAANGQLGAPVPMSDEHNGGVDGGYGVAYSVGSDGYVHSANAVGSEV